jgi:phosphatidylglycerophosphatase A
VSAERPTLAFMLRHPAHLLALGFGAGLAPVAPGTFGTLVAIPLAWWLRPYGDLAFLAATAAFFVIGIWASEVTSRDLGVEDAGAIVWDEVVAFLLVLFFVGDDSIRIAFAFLAFRLFDIAKPPPIRQLDAALTNGFGIMADDIVAAGYALLVFAVWQRLFGAG